jgi:hypothetical protein
MKTTKLDGHDLNEIDEAIEKAMNVDEKDWLYLVHHMHPNKKNLLSMEDLHHCDMFSQKDKKGDVYTLKHVKISEKNIVHVIDTKDIDDVPKTLYDHLNNGLTVKNRTVNDTKYATLAGLDNKKDKVVEELDAGDKDKIISEFEYKIAELELQLKEQEMKEETEDDIYTKLYDEFARPSGGLEGQHTDKHTDELTIDDIEKYIKEVK